MLITRCEFIVATVLLHRITDGGGAISRGRLLLKDTLELVDLYWGSISN